MEAPSYTTTSFQNFEIHMQDKPNVKRIFGAKYGLEDGSKEEGHVKRSLQQRHISMLAIGGTIGTGLFLGMGNSLRQGPLALLLGYLFMGTVVYSVLVSLGEMVTLFPVSGSLPHYAGRFVDPALGFAVGWNYWYSFVICLAAEVTAASIVVGYWKTPLSEGVWITIFFVTSCSINFFGVRWYGETESAFAISKILAVAILLVTGMVLDLGGGPSHDMIGFRYWKNPGAFRQLEEIPGVGGRFLSFWSVFVQAAYSYLGAETVALAAGEASNPRKTVPKAISTVFYRALVIGLLVPFDEPRLLGGTGDASSSPFVIAINRADAGSRVLYGLAKDNMAPRFLARCTKNGLPVAATILSVLPGFLAYMNLSEGSANLFQWLVSVSAMTGLITWWSVCMSYIRLHRAMRVQAVDRDSLHYKAPFQPYLSYYGLIMLTLIILFNGFQTMLPHKWSWGSFISAYISLPVFAGTFFIWKLMRRTKVVSLHEMDLVTFQKDIESPADI